jgi:uncharacterized PurR-regulated membrane protein YhhQ (DUF165 family)
MEAFINALVGNPFAAMVIFLSVCGAVAFLFYMWGFIGYINAHGHDEHQEHARTSMIWGLSWLFVLFLVWLAVRAVADFFGY